jgi:hypothetical protein
VVRLLDALARGWEAVRRALGHVAARHVRHEEEDRAADARARFWVELRQGQREAEAQASRPRP